jgi:hypothetical protein
MCTGAAPARTRFSTLERTPRHCAALQRFAAAATASIASANCFTDSHQEIDSTVGIMRDNINKVSERGARLDSLQDKTDNLAQSAQGFRRGANRVRKQMWWKDMKMRMCLIVGIIILLVIIIVPSGKPLYVQLPRALC